MKRITILVTLLTLVILLAVFIIFYFVPKNSDSLIFYKAINKIEAPKELSITTMPTISEQELDSIENSSSEYNGKWAGLCTKNSISSSNVSDPIKAFQNTVMSDPTLVKHYSDFVWSRAAVTTLDTITTDTKVNVTHRSGSIIKSSKKEIKLKETDEVITDGRRVVRTFCCNDIIIRTPQQPNISPPAKKIEPTPVYTITPHVDPVPFVSLVKDVPSELSIHNYGVGGRHIEYVEKPSPPPTAPVPEPTTLLLFGTGLAAITFLNRKNRRR